MLKQASVQVITNQVGQVLLLERTGDHAHFPDEWCLPGGKRELDYESQLFLDKGGVFNFRQPTYKETIEETNYRETFEETGIKTYAFHNQGITLMDDKFHCIVFHAIGHNYTPDATMFPNREHKAFGWFYKHELPEKLGKMTRLLLEEILD